MGKDSLTITDNRTGQTIEVPIEYGTYPKYGAAIPAAALRDLKVDDEDFGMMTYDPGYGNTASCKSSVTFIDGERGILRYRGYPIEQLLNIVIIWKSLICCSMVNCPHKARLIFGVRVFESIRCCMRVLKHI